LRQTVELVLQTVTAVLGPLLRGRGSNLLKLAVSLGLVWLAFSRVDLSTVGLQLASAKLGFFIVALAVYMLAITVNAVKWQILMRAQGVVIPWIAAVEFQFVGFFFNNFLPMVGGDVMRGYGLARYTDRTTAAAVSVIMDRIVGLLAYMASALIAGFIAVTITGRSDLRHVEVAALVALLLLAVAFGVLLSRSARRLIGLVFTLGPLRALAPLWEHISAAFNAYRFRYRSLALAFATAILGILCTAAVNWSLSQSMGGQMSLLSILLFNPLIALVGMIPLFVAGLGINQMTYPFFFGLVGVSENHAIAVSVLMQLVIVLGSLPGGFFWLRGRRSAVELLPRGSA
jgi:glycosyltransferase 2 family protein